MRLCYRLNLSDGSFSIIANFLAVIGLPVEVAEISHPTFLPGIHADLGILRVDSSKLSWPGDLLHEAGHLALLTGERRRQVTGSVGDDGGEELGAIAWSYAAAVHLQLDPAVVFHEHGYHGGSRSILENFAEGRYIGVPMLQWLGLTLDARSAGALGVEPYPHMLRWLRA
jgi:hypothetical protein